jgi:hypothetical protein
LSLATHAQRAGGQSTTTTYFAPQGSSAYPEVRLADEIRTIQVLPAPWDLLFPQARAGPPVATPNAAALLGLEC